MFLCMKLWRWIFTLVEMNTELHSVFFPSRLFDQITGERSLVCCCEVCSFFLSCSQLGWSIVLLTTLPIYQVFVCIPINKEWVTGQCMSSLIKTKHCSLSQVRRVGLYHVLDGVFCNGWRDSSDMFWIEFSECMTWKRLYNGDMFGCRRCFLAGLATVMLSDIRFWTFDFQSLQARIMYSVNEILGLNFQLVKVYMEL